MATVTSPQSTAVNEFVRLVEKRIKETGISITELARQAGVGRPYLHRVLSGEQDPSLEWAEKVARPLGLKIKTVKA
jgi:DNA-binding phage protein